MKCEQMQENYSINECNRLIHERDVDWRLTQDKVLKQQFQIINVSVIKSSNKIFMHSKWNIKRNQKSLILLEDQWNWNMFGDKSSTDSLHSMVLAFISHATNVQPLKSFVIIWIVAIKPLKFSLHISSDWSHAFVS